MIAPADPGSYQQACVTFTGYGDNVGRIIHSVVPSGDPDKIVDILEFIRDRQRDFIVEQDARIQWRHITVGPWEEA